MTQLFDRLDAAKEAALRASIRRFGIWVPVVYDHKGVLLDGHHRTRIAEEEGVECPSHVQNTEGMTEAEIDAALLDVNNIRRPPAEVRRSIVAELRADGHSTRAIAAALGVSQPTVVADLKVSGDQGLSPDVKGLDGKTYPARPKAPESAPEPQAPKRAGRQQERSRSALGVSLAFVAVGRTIQTAYESLADVPDEILEDQVDEILAALDAASEFIESMRSLVNDKRRNAR